MLPSWDYLLNQSDILACIPVVRTTFLHLSKLESDNIFFFLIIWAVPVFAMHWLVCTTHAWTHGTSNPERTKIHCRLVIVKLRSHKNTRERARSTQKYMAYCTRYAVYLERLSDSAIYRKRGKFSKIGHGGPSQDSILRRTSVTDFWFFRKNIFIVKSHMFFAGHLG